ncbi:MAG: glutaconate CoA-transferase [Clostridiales bacterium]|nr:glutaconate CoA-transferase [Clostridiales bacterium]
MEAKHTLEYTPTELMIVISAREIEDGDLVFAGVGNPTLGALLARMTHAPSSLIATESGCIGPSPKRIMLGIGDNAGLENCIALGSLWRLFSDQQRGFVDIGMVGGAQIDRFGNLNSTAIFGEGDYFTPAARLPGSGGANDIANCAKRTVISIPLERRRFLEKVDYITSPGFLTGDDARRQAGLPGGGPAAVITDKCIFRFHPETKEMMLVSVHPGTTVEDVQKEVPWKLLLADEVTVTPPPTAEEVAMIRALDEDGIYTGTGLKTLTFDRYIEMLERSLAQFSE